MLKWVADCYLATSCFSTCDFIQFLKAGKYSLNDPVNDFVGFSAADL